jgi:diguanylate cyclase (GGDEF)-like protein
MNANAELADTALGYDKADKVVCSDVVNSREVQTSLELNVASLYQHIEIDDLLSAFAERLGVAVNHDEFEFRNTDLEVDYRRRDHRLAASVPHKLRYRITDQHGCLGVMEIGRNTQFRSDEVRKISVAVNAFTGPLSNANLYRRACQSAYRDPLTGVRNRAALDEALSYKSASSLRRDSALVLLVCDVDRFKSVNDSCGHTVGDEVLRQFARILQDNTRDTDIVFRYGGDEFVIALQHTQLAGGRELAQRIRRAVKQTTVRIGNACINLTTTVGITEVKPHEPLDDAFLRADEALLTGKKAGRDRVVCNEEGDCNSGPLVTDVSD